MGSSSNPKVGREISCIAVGVKRYFVSGQWCVFLALLPNSNQDIYRTEIVKNCWLVISKQIISSLNVNWKTPFMVFKAKKCLRFYIDERTLLEVYKSRNNENIKINIGWVYLSLLGYLIRVCKPCMRSIHGKHVSKINWAQCSSEKFVNAKSLHLECHASKLI